MEARIQFRISEETKKLAQLAAERKGVTLSDACRNLTEELAKDQMKLEKHNDWLVEQVNNAYHKRESGQSNFVSHETANAIVLRRINKLKSDAGI